MKYLPKLMLLAIVVSFTACGGSGNPSETLASTKWMIDVDTMMDKMMDQMPEEAKKMMKTEKGKERMKKQKERMEKGRIVFEKGGVFKTVGPDGEEQKGTWKLSDDNKTITIMEKEGKDPTTYNVESIGSSKVLLSEKKGERTNYMALKAAN